MTQLTSQHLEERLGTSWNAARESLLKLPEIEGIIECENWGDFIDFHRTQNFSLWKDPKLAKAVLSEIIDYIRSPYIIDRFDGGSEGYNLRMNLFKRLALESNPNISDYYGNNALFDDSFFDVCLGVSALRSGYLGENRTEIANDIDVISSYAQQIGAKQGRERYDTAAKFKALLSHLLNDLFRDQPAEFEKKWMSYIRHSLYYCTGAKNTDIRNASMRGGTIKGVNPYHCGRIIVYDPSSVSRYLIATSVASIKPFSQVDIVTSPEQLIDEVKKGPNHTVISEVYPLPPTDLLQRVREVDRTVPIIFFGVNADFALELTKDRHATFVSKDYYGLQTLRRKISDRMIV